MQQVGEAGEAAAALLPFFCKAKHAFFPALQAIQVGWAGSSASACRAFTSG